MKTIDLLEDTTILISPHQHQALIELKELITGQVLFRDNDQYHHNDNNTNDKISTRTTNIIKNKNDSSSDNSFDRFSRVWVRQVGPPYALVLVASEEDIVHTINCFQRYDIPFRIRSGGHHKLGYSTLTNGIVLDLQLLNTIEWLPEEQEPSTTTTSSSSSMVGHSTSDTSRSSHSSIIRVGPAVTVKELYQFLRPYNRSAVMGFCGSVAESGFVLGGGWGILSRRYGLGLDNVGEFRIVTTVTTPNTRIDASKDSTTSRTETTTTNVNHHHHHSSSSAIAITADGDLDWALRGAGGGSFGVVTYMTYRVHPISPWLTFMGCYIPSTMDRAEFLYRVGELNPPGNLVLIHDELKTVNMMWWGTTDPEVMDGEAYMKKLIVDNGGNSVTFEIAHLTWDDLYNNNNNSKETTNATTIPWGNSVYAAACWTGFLVPENNTRAVWNEILQILDEQVDEYLLPDIELWGGAISHIGRDDTAFPYRDAIYNVGVLLIVSEESPEFYQSKVAAVDQWWPRVAQHLQGTYVNYPMKNASPQIMWGDHLTRLRQVKKQYDPENLFHHPLSVPL